LIFRANLLFERAKAEVRKAPWPALRPGRATVAQATAGSRTGVGTCRGHAAFFGWRGLGRQSEPGDGLHSAAGKSGRRRQSSMIRSSARKLRRSD
jgi:hypothetical protein